MPVAGLDPTSPTAAYRSDAGLGPGGWHGAMSGNGVDLAAISQLLGTVASDVRELRREVAGESDKDDLARLRQALVDYHSAVIGRGVLISERR